MLTAHKPAIQGHRGARGLFPENSLPAIKAGIDAGCDAIEVDLCVTADNQLVIHHDLTLSAHLVRDQNDQWVSGRTRIRDQTLRQIKRYKIGTINPHSEKGKRYAKKFPFQQAVADTCIPTLDEFVALVKKHDRKVIYNLELKSKHPKDTPAVSEYIDLVVAALKKHDIVKRVFLQSFEQELVVEAKSRLAALKVGFTTRKTEVENDTCLPAMLESMVESGVNVWSADYRTPVLNAEHVQHAHNLGLEVGVWTVNREQDMQRMIDLGVDAITTDYPNRLFALLAGMGHR